MSCKEAAETAIVAGVDNYGGGTHNRARTVNPLEHTDSFHLQAAVGWLELGNWLEANEERELITPQMRAHRWRGGMAKQGVLADKQVARPEAGKVWRRHHQTL